MTSPVFDPQDSLERLLPIIDYAQSLLMAISIGEEPDLGEMLGRLFGAQAEQANILRGLIYDIYR